MKIRSEVKIGIIGIVTLAVLIWGINYLKGRNILKSTYTLHAFYNDANGLESSAPVLINGVKIGFVQEVNFLQDEEIPIEVVLSIEEAYPKSTKDANLVEKHSATMGITDTFVGGLIVKSNAPIILSEAKRLEEETKED